MTWSGLKRESLAGGVHMRFLQGEEFTVSLRDLYQKGGRFQKAAETVQMIWGRAQLDPATRESVFVGIAKTNHGENRIPHCIKYDLTGHARLVVALHRNVCIFLYAGDHSNVDAWIDRNRGLDFVAKSQGDAVVLEKVRVSQLEHGKEGLISRDSDLSKGPLLNFLPERYRIRLLHDLEEDTLGDLMSMESVAKDDLLLDVCAQICLGAQQEAVLDVLLSLRAGDVTSAKSRIDLYSNVSRPVQELPSDAVETLQSSDAAVLLSDIDPELFEHFVRTASFEKWMLYLHPAQRQQVDRDFKGPARMSGVSGSGKTCVVVHRALRLAEKHSGERILVVTLSAALASLIDQLMDAQRGKSRPKNLRVVSIFDLCFEKLMQIEPERRDYYTKRSIARNPHAIPEHIDEVWHEYFMCENNNDDADVLLDVIKSLNTRGIYAEAYLRQEMDYIRSSYAPRERDGYLSMDRQGRIVPLDEPSRRSVLEGLAGWERKMNAVGVIDDMGIIAALYKYLDLLEPEYRAVLVDEAQDLGTLELAVIRRLAAEGDNDIFLCGDAAQTIHTKSTDLKLAGIDVTGRSVRLNQNYRNSRQILTASYEVLTRALEAMPKGAMQLEILAPEYASFSSPRPLLLRASSISDELGFALNFLSDIISDGIGGRRCCLAMCGFSQSAIEELGQQLELPVLDANTDIAAGQIFLSDLEQTKGFEFDGVVVLNCSFGVVPHPNLPGEESFRDLCRLYVAMTRAKSHLVISYTERPSPFIEGAAEFFTEAEFGEYTDKHDLSQIRWPMQAIPKLLEPETWALPGKKFLKARDAVGLDRVVQDELLDHVTGIQRTRGTANKQVEWKTFGAFAKAMENPRLRHQILSDVGWGNLSNHLKSLRGPK